MNKPQGRSSKIINSSGVFSGCTRRKRCTFLMARGCCDSRNLSKAVLTRAFGCSGRRGLMFVVSHDLTVDLTRGPESIAAEYTVG